MDEQFGSDIRVGDIVFAMGIDVPARLVDVEFEHEDDVETAVLEMPNGSLIYVALDRLELAPVA